MPRIKANLLPILGCDLIVGVCCLAVGEGAAVPLPVELHPSTDAFSALLQEQTAIILQSLQPKESNDRKARIAALVLAAAAQHDLSGRDGQYRATVRDAALEIAWLIWSNQRAQALRKAQQLGQLRADSHAKRERVKLVPEGLQADELHLPFVAAKKGGQSIEGYFQVMVMRNEPFKKMNQMDMNDDLVRAAMQTAMVAELLKEVPPKGAANWPAWFDSTRDASLRLADATRARNGKAAFALLDWINNGCTSCHQGFRAGGIPAPPPLP